MSIELVMLFNHLILCYSLLLLPSVFPSIRVFYNEFVSPPFFPQTYLFLTEGKLLHNIALASAIHQHVSATGIHVSPPSLNSLPPPILSHPSRLLQSPGLSSLHHTANSHWLPILYIVGYMLLYSLSICHTLTFLLLTHVHKSVLYVCISTVAVYTVSIFSPIYFHEVM